VVPYRFADVTNTLFNSASKLNSFAINLENTYADDRVLYQNSETKINHALIEQMGTLTLQTIYDDAQDPTQETTKLGADTQITNVLTFNGTTDMAWTMKGRVMDFTAPDQDKGQVLADYSIELVREGANLALSVAVS
jgi:hypothetical protein